MQQSRMERLEGRTYFDVITFDGTEGFNASRDTLRMSNGDVIVAGIFGRTVTFGPGVTFTSRGNTDAFFARYTQAGDLVWARQFGGIRGGVRLRSGQPVDVAINPRRTGSEFVNGVSVDPRNAGEYANGIVLGSDNGVYFTGGFRGGVDFSDGVTTQSRILETDRNYPDIFLLKLDADTGNLLRAQQYGGQFTDIGMDMVIDAQDNIYIGGQYTRTADFDPGPGKFLLTALGRADAFTMKLNTNGEPDWVRSMGSDAIGRARVEAVNGLAVDALGNTYITGTFARTANFGPLVGSTTPVRIASDDETDIFTAKLDPDGGLLWVKTQGGPRYDGGRELMLIGDPSAPEIITASYFERTIDADPGPAEAKLTAAPEQKGETPFATDIMFTRFKNDGGFVWAKQIGGGFFETIGRMSIDRDNNIYLTGGFEQTVDFNPSATQFNLTSIRLPNQVDDPNESDGNRRSSYDGYFMSLSPNGAFRFAEQFGGNQDDFGIGLSREPVGSDVTGFYLGGRFSGTANLAPAPGNITRTATAKTAVFVSLFDTEGNLV